MITVVSAYYELFACPTIVVGKTDDGGTVYARYRWGCLSVRIDPRDDPPQGGAGGAWVFNRKYGNEYDGCISYEELREITQGEIEWPDHLHDPPPRDGDAFDLLEL